jgi:large subunit ribosomal protein L13
LSVAPPAASGRPHDIRSQSRTSTISQRWAKAGPCSSEGVAPPPAPDASDAVPTNERVTFVRTYSPRPGDIQRAWHVIDATDIVLGRLAVQSANLLRGKHKPIYAPHVDTGDFVIIVNAEKIALTGDKLTNKLAYRHSGYPGGLTATPIGQLLEKDARKVIEKAVWGMLPKNKLGRQIIKKLKVYSGPTHPHQAQQAVPFEITQISQ